MDRQLNIFHNTIHLEGVPLSDALAKAVMQNHKVYVVMQYKKMATPSQVHALSRPLCPSRASDGP